MMKLYPLIIACIASLATIVGNILLFIDVKYKDKLLSFSLGLSFVVMLLVSLFELIPEGINLIYYRYNKCFIYMFCLSLLFIGYFLVNFFDKKIKSDDSLYRVGILSMLSLFIHNIPEGIICALFSTSNVFIGMKIGLIIMIHNIPEGICISLPVYYSTGSRLKGFLMSFISSLGEIFGAVLSITILYKFINDFIMCIILIITAGIMISLSVTRILKEGLSFKQYYWLILGMFVGLLIILFTI